MCHVLVIEDEPFIAEYIGDIAIESGATSLDFADTEATAIEAACTRLPAVILSDVSIIGGTGPMAIAEIRERCGPVPVIFITATPKDCEHCDYAAAILTKPIMRSEVATAFRSVSPV